MTHDELLSKIDKNWDDDYDYCDVQRDKALRAVVELHKPSGQGLGYAAYCHQCMFNHGSGEIKNHAYPCPTIQAIEKELV
jgi:CRISPR/Cas system-associated exonuclease Cas4 (RecB family)